MLNRRSFIAGAGAAVMGIGGCGQFSNSARRPANKRVNILVLTSDEHNPFVSSVEGNPVVKTPNMDRLAKMGTVYSSSYCPSPLCTPSRSAFMAGKYVHQLQTYNNCCVFKHAYPSYGQLLAEQGIHTVHMGKIDVYRNAYELGFSEMLLGDWEVVRDPGDINISRKPLSIRSLSDPTGGSRHARYGVKKNAFNQDELSISTALDWIRTKGVTINKPWMVNVNLSKPHFPMEVTQELWDLYQGHDDLADYGPECESAQHPYAQDLRHHFQTDKYPESSVRGLRRGYYGCVTYVDRKLGELLDVLEETGMLDNTVVIYTSDHGDMHGKFGMWWKCSLYEDSVRVPLIIAGPGFRKNYRSTTAVNSLDVQASIFKSLGCSRPSNWVGTPLQGLTGDDPDKVAFSEYHGHGTRASAFMVRKGMWKYLFYSEAPNQLFNIADDPNELTNLITKYPGVAQKMEKELRRICCPETENQRAESYIQQQLAALKNANLKVMPGGIAVEAS